MKMSKKLLVSMAVLSVAILAGVTYAFTALTVTSTVSVKEPLFISTAVATGDLLTDGVTCTISTNTLSATCTGNVFAGDTGTIEVTVGNAGHESIFTSPSAVSSSTDVTVNLNPTAATNVTPGGTIDFSFPITVSPSASLATTTLNFYFFR